jgi:hypothetical protein
MNQKQLNDLIYELAQGLRNKQKFGAPITVKYIEGTVNKLVHDLEELPDFEIDESEIDIIKFRLGNMFNIKIGEQAITLSNPDIARWFDSKKSALDWKYWDAYKSMLESQARPLDVINATEEVIDKILDFSGDPTLKGVWSRKGLVMGNVQSGKTQNYIGLINKAIDSGYKIIIVLGGHLNDLRKQTQERVDEGVIGRESKHFVSARNKRAEPIGVGNFRGEAINVHTFTTTAGDFTKPFADSLGVTLTGLSDPAIFTVKKNTSILKSLYEWILEVHYLKPASGVKLDLPIMIIDDEADYASVNTKAHKDEVTRTNEYIRKLLTLFNRSTYIGYTATPFANIFIDPDSEDEAINDDLFPNDFMVKIPVPENYIGQDFYFKNKNSSTHFIDDHEALVGLKTESYISIIPNSLKEAIRGFYLIIAIRYLRGDKTSHNTMLVNVSHLKQHQDRLEFLIAEYHSSIEDALETYSGLGVKEANKIPILKELYTSFENSFEVDIPEEYGDIFSLLTLAVGKTKVWAVNQGKNSQVLDYSKFEEYGLCAIVIGGHKLSRGLTLEGLSVSYFTRNSKAYDTLMQMCRWFGYRPRYADLCRVYLPFESFHWYSFISTAIRELYGELDQMSKAEKRPSEFGLKVRDHPGAMIITARNKMNAAKSEIRSQDLWGQVLRRFRFRKNEEINKKNIKYSNEFINRINITCGSQSYSRDFDSAVYSDVPYAEVIRFIENIDLPEDEVGNKALIKHLKEMEKSKLKEFKVTIYNQYGSSKFEPEGDLTADDYEFLDGKYSFGSQSITLPKRTMKSDGMVYSYPSVQLGNPDDEKLFLSESEIGRIKKEKNNAISFDYICSPERDFPGLIIYLFAVRIRTPFTKTESVDSIYSLGYEREAALGYTVSLPRTANYSGKSAKELKSLIRQTRHSYQVNKVYSEQLKVIDLAEGEADE